ncbi:MAG: hypothetical protein JWL70_614 [Acidimicrobiia bacterium]|nr:hypothetical protein [Acidimicrobiia bacterium]
MIDGRRYRRRSVFGPARRARWLASLLEASVAMAASYDLGCMFPLVGPFDDLRVARLADGGRDLAR